ncbi:MAG: polymer-forming cytoskeletal protein [Calditerrivibrio sp.]|nr:polymer-forming cytoskeletal protein [Calditerrivibrio sp.]MCA1932734.1 polymer-forming cytoskeletal protein [Calditerrivibrio sp.]MCA1979906.1 polymer-forming cytoskeletal protein [Calditerrivibrio sp.]
MFKEKKRDEEITINAFLGNKTNFNGTLVFDGIVRIDGSFKGNIVSSDTLIIANTGEVEADVETSTVKISGKFNGTIKAKTIVELLKPAVVHGTIITPMIKIEEGAKINGNVQMTEEGA